MGCLRKRPTRSARLRSRTTASSGMRHIASSCTSYTHVYLATRGCRCSLVGPRRAPDPPVKRAGTITRNAYTQGKGELAWDTWPNRLVLRLSLQSGHKTNDPVKSGPAKAGPAGPATPPLITPSHVLSNKFQLVSNFTALHVLTQAIFSCALLMPLILLSANVQSHCLQIYVIPMHCTCTIIGLALGTRQESLVTPALIKQAYTSSCGKYIHVHIYITVCHSPSLRTS